MRAFPFPIAAVLSVMFALSIPSYGAGKPKPAQGNQTPANKVWTNADIDELRERGLISIIGPEVQEPVRQEPATTAVASAPTVAGSGFPRYNSRFEDPEWYAEQAAYLQAELDRRQALLREQQTAIALAARGITQPGIALDKPNYGITPEAALANLEAQVVEVQNWLDELADLARANNIPLGVVQLVPSNGL